MIHCVSNLIFCITFTQSNKLKLWKMKTISNEQLLKELASRQREAIQKHRTETSSQTVSRLLGSLCKEWVSSDGKIFSLRSYLMKYDRNELRKYLHAISLHISNGASFFRQEKALDSWFLSDYKHPYLSGMAFDGRIKSMKLR